MRTAPRHRVKRQAFMERLIDRIPACLMSRLLRLLQFVSGLSLLWYAIASLYSFDLAFPWFNLGLERESQIVMIACGAIQLMCALFHCPRCVFVASWPAAVIFSYLAICAKGDEVTRHDIWLAAALLAATNWFISSVSSWKMKRAACGRLTPRSD